MLREEAQEVFKDLMAAYKWMDLTPAGTNDLWYDSLKQFDFAEVRAAARNWIRFSSTEPTIKDMIDAVHNVRTTNRNVTPDYVDWRSIESVRCRNCNDHGFLTVVYPTGYEEMRVCDCQAGHDRFPWLFTEEFEKKFKWLHDTEDHEAASQYMYGMSVEDVHKARFKEVRSVEGHGYIILRKEATR